MPSPFVPPVTGPVVVMVMLPPGSWRETYALMPFVPPVTGPEVVITILPVLLPTRYALMPFCAPVIVDALLSVNVRPVSPARVKASPAVVTMLKPGVVVTLSGVPTRSCVVVSAPLQL